jgi:hypothetical protein
MYIAVCDQLLPLIFFLRFPPLLPSFHAFTAVAMRAWYDSTFVGDATRYSRALLGVLIVLWTLGMLFGRFATDLFALTPGYALGNYYVWGQKQSK